MRAIILSIGDELVLGQTVDTNSAWLSTQLASVGCEILAHITVADDQDAIQAAIENSASRCDVILVNGGLGPTPDDLTRQAIAAALDQPLELNAEWLNHMEEFFRKRARSMPPANRIQAMIPRGAKMIWNHNGTAAGIQADLKTVQHSCRIFVMPGVPKEMMLMYQRDVAPHISTADGPVIISRTLHTFGLGESAVAQMLGDLMDRNRNPSVGTTVSAGVVSLRLNARAPSRTAALADLDRTDFLCRTALGDLIYGHDSQTLAAVVGEMLAKKSLSVATAESCTAGLLAKYLTDMPGSSRFFRQGWITYSDAAKTAMLAVPEELLRAHGAVSIPVVQEMGRGARRLASADFALAISGIAGPDGGTPDKPVGTVCIALAFQTSNSSDTADTYARSFNFPGDREMIRDRAAKMALAFLRFHLLQKPLPF